MYRRVYSRCPETLLEKLENKDPHCLWPTAWYANGPHQPVKRDGVQVYANNMVFISLLLI